MKKFDETEVLETILSGFGRALSQPGVPTRIRFESFNRVILVVLDDKDNAVEPLKPNPGRLARILERVAEAAQDLFDNFSLIEGLHRSS